MTIFRPVSDGTHECPRSGCTKRVDDVMFACRADWFALSLVVRREILVTKRLSLVDPRRRAAIQLAHDAWAKLDRR